MAQHRRRLRRICEGGRAVGTTLDRSPTIKSRTRTCGFPQLPARLGAAILKLRIGFQEIRSMNKCRSILGIAIGTIKIHKEGKLNV